MFFFLILFSSLTKKSNGDKNFYEDSISLGYSRWKDGSTIIETMQIVMLDPSIWWDGQGTSGECKIWLEVQF